MALPIVSQELLESVSDQNDEGKLDADENPLRRFCDSQPHLAKQFMLNSLALSPELAPLVMAAIVTMYEMLERADCINELEESL